jgi:hypothetical protein
VDFSFSSAWALVFSSQNPGCPESRSISAMRDRLRSRSKMPPERVEALLEAVDLLHRVVRHDVFVLF